MDSQTPTMNWDVSDPASAFSLFKQRCNLYFRVKGIQGEDQVPFILLAVGDKGLERYNSWRLTGEQKKDPKTIWDKFEEQLRPAVNFRVARLKLSRYAQRSEETLDEFVNRAKSLATRCKFTEPELNERILELVIASTPIAEFQKELLTKEAGYTVDQLLQLGRAYEAASSHVEDIRRLNGAAKVETVTNGKECRYCGTTHPFDRDLCPALKSTCDKCGKIGHWAIKCNPRGRRTYRQDYRPRSSPRSSPMRNNRSRRQSGSCYESRRWSRPRSQTRSRHRRSSKSPDRRKTLHTVQDDIDTLPDSFESFTFNEVKGSKQDRDEAFVTLRIKIPSIHKLQMKVDTGAQRNTLPLRIYKQMFPHGCQVQQLSSHVRLYTYDNKEIHHFGTVKIPCQFEDGEWTELELFVVDVSGPSLMCLKTAISLGIIQLNCSLQTTPSSEVTAGPVNSIDDLKRNYPEQFDRIGCFPGKVKLYVDKGAQPHIDPPRKTPIALKDEIKAELDKMVVNGVIRKVTEPTEWVSSLVYSKKKDGSLRICLDPRHLNAALKRPHHKTPTLEELNHKFAKSTCFSKLDAKSGYWSVQLDEESQLLTTFQSSFGRYCFTRLPFGLSVSQDIFQHRMDMILEQCPGAEGIADDVVVHGETDEEHDRNLHTLMKVAQKDGLVFNSDKCDIKKDQISFFGNTYGRKGIKPDKEKIVDLQQMPTPQNRTELQEFLGMVNYLSPFIPNLSKKTYVLRGLLKEDSDFIWESHHQKAYDDLKSCVTEESNLQYFDTKKIPVVHTDASEKGIGAALLQEDDRQMLRPVAYASKALTDAESRYACIERELLAIVYAVQRFHTYLYGRRFIVVTDHKPLIMILDKNIRCAPPRLQRLMLKLQGYDFEIQHQAGKKNVLADTLSRLPRQERCETVDLDIRVDFVRFNATRVELIREETAKDPSLNALSRTIIMGWPENIKEVPSPIREYWSFRDELSVQNGVIMKGERILIPHSMTEDILEQLHYGHLGIEKTKLRAKESVYWLDINKDIEKMVQRCMVCQESKPNQQHETLLPHEVPDSAWKVCGTDIFHFEGDEYLIVADYYSKFPLIRKLPRPCPSSAIVDITKMIFSELGVPEKVISDNGPHFSSVQYQNFMKNWEIVHVTSSPRYPRSNGFVERHIQTVKNVMKKAKQSNQDITLALLCLRCTPIDHKLPSPAELLYGRKVKTTLPSSIVNNRRDKDEIQDRLLHRQKVMKEIHDRSAKDLPPLHEGQTVTYQQQPGGPWLPATVVQKAESSQPRSYIISSPKGILRRNRVHIRDRHVRFAPETTEVEDNSGTPLNQHSPMDTQNSYTDKTEVSTSVANEQIAHTTRSGRLVKTPRRYDL